MKNSLVASAVVSALAASTPLWGQDVRPPEKITVTASPLGRSDAELAQPATVLTDEELRRRRGTNIGDTLSQEPGVQSSAFGAGAGRPIIRGLDGPRIRVLENGIGTGDVSSVSPDHGVATETLRAEQIEILRGPASLLYGSGAIGGIVNVVSKTIPRRMPAALEGNVEARVSSANRERSGGFDLDGGAGAVAWHADAFKRRTRDYDTPLGRLDNSDVDMRGGAVGASWVGTRGFLGAGAQQLENDYGVPSGEGVRIRMKQERQEVAGEASDPFAFFTRVRARAARSDYRHDEIEAGEVGTTFRNQAHEGRIELRHGGAFSGTVGMQWQGAEISALGEEAILPRTKSRAAALFVVEEKEIGAWTFDAGLRIERERRRPEGDLPSRDFSLTTPALGAVWRFTPGHALAIYATQAQRAPAVEELYTFGPHHATETFDIGNPRLRKEVSRSIDVSLRRTEGALRWKLGAYYNRFKDFVYGAADDLDGDGVADRVDEEGILDPEGEFLVQRYTQAAAVFRGVEAEVAYRPPGAALGWRIFADATRGRLSSGENLPRIAPARFGASVEWRWGALGGFVTALHVLEQKRTAPLESATPSYTKLDAELSWTLERNPGRSIKVFLQGTNLLDEEIRIHTSFLKQFAPQMGRSATLGVRAEF